MLDYKNMESSINDISRFVLVDKKQWKNHLKDLFDLNDNEFVAYKIEECPDAPDCYYFVILKKNGKEYED